MVYLEIRHELGYTFRLCEAPSTVSTLEVPHVAPAAKMHSLLFFQFFLQGTFQFTEVSKT